MSEREVIIAVLRKELNQIQNICCNMQDLKKEIQTLEKELEDESRLGVPAGYDYGLKNIKTIERKLLKKINTEIKALKDVQSSLEKLQRDSSSKIPPEMESFSKD